jgi:hypothetical protein
VPNRKDPRFKKWKGNGRFSAAPAE